MRTRYKKVEGISYNDCSDGRCGYINYTTITWTRYRKEYSEHIYFPDHLPREQRSKFITSMLENNFERWHSILSNRGENVKLQL